MPPPHRIPPHPRLPARRDPPSSNLHHDAQPLRVGQLYSELMERAVRRGESVGYGVPEFALGDDDGLVSEDSLSRPSSPVLEGLEAPATPAEDLASHPSGSNDAWPSQELLSRAVSAARDYRLKRKASQSPEERPRAGPSGFNVEGEGTPADEDSPTSRRKARRGRRGGRNQPGKKPAHNAGQGAVPGKNNSSHEGKKRRKKEGKEQRRERTRNRPYERVHEPGFFKRHQPVFLVSLTKLDVVYDTTAYGYTHNTHHIKIKRRCWTDEDIARARYTTFEWDGSDTLAIIDASDIVVGLLLAGPKDDDRVYWERYEACGPRLYEAITAQLQEHPRAWTKGLGSKRGDFCSMTAGINYNYSKKVPDNLVMDAHQRAVADALLSNRDLQRVVGHATEGVAHFFPLAYNHAADRMGRLHELLPHLDFPFDNSIYPTITINGGPQTATYEHADIGNFAGLPCWVYTSGLYDPKKSARFIMHGLRLVVTFPPHRIVALSSAGVRHSNTQLQPGETRYSTAGYMSGALMRYAAYGGNVGGLSYEERERVERECQDSWVHQQARLSNFWDLEEDREKAQRLEQARARGRRQGSIGSALAHK